MLENVHHYFVNCVGYRGRPNMENILNDFMILELKYYYEVVRAIFVSNLGVDREFCDTV
jgi:hypothetical protein